MGNPAGAERHKGVETGSEDTLAENVPEQGKQTDLWVQETEFQTR